ncbi:hypothetical protein HanIR_Chr08g0358041 [Helianthus annuus]|nr:hypothetical protein HanIR_Chr08g0358041 [Helianthus annuus]
MIFYTILKNFPLQIYLDVLQNLVLFKTFKLPKFQFLMITFMPKTLSSLPLE